MRARHSCSSDFGSSSYLLMPVQEDRQALTNQRAIAKDEMVQSFLCMKIPDVSKPYSGVARLHGYLGFPCLTLGHS